jgi:hypothetical protein
MLCVEVNEIGSEMKSAKVSLISNWAPKHDETWILSSIMQIYVLSLYEKAPGISCGVNMLGAHIASLSLV